ncbi:MAG: alpha-galactosidase [Lachnospiraceae bacterium]|nr:alpha-galactosidase [Lachnospiraceae bacterium]
MGICFYEKEKVFQIDTKNTSYVIALIDKEGFVGHAYYGKRLYEADVAYLTRMQEGCRTPETNERDRLSFYDCFPMEYPTHGIGDFRESALRVEDANGHWANKLTYKGHEIFAGKKKLAGLPATWCEKEEDAQTLELTLEDKEAGLEVVLSYSVFADVDAVVRSARIVNVSETTVYLTKAMSASFDMDNRDYDKILLYGSWARERHIDRTPVNYGIQMARSNRGEGGHQEHAFTALLEKNADQNHGEVYGMDLIYSGNFRTLMEKNQFDNIRTMTGINPEDFRWELVPGAQFQTPEAVLVYSEEGLGGMSRCFHDLYRNHLIRGYYRDKKRPILINNWEATYFNFSTEKLLSIARDASALGIEMLVMDDGWFGNRYDDNRALGDWEVNEEKLQGGLGYLVDEVNKLGMKFGIWFEPEMISPESELYKEHPDWAIQVPGRVPGLARNQMVLDISREEVADYIFEKMAKVLHSANIEYVKWDMNRPLSDIASAALPKERQGEIFHRYVLGVYRMQERLLTEFPNLLLENCSGGGARFDAGMLYYSPQIWTSDDTDAIERLEIQEGTALIYPLSAMGAHVSDCPNHTVGRTTPFATRGVVALAGTFGYELDVTKISENDRNQIPEQCRTYHKYNDLVRTGDYYRMASYRETHTHDAYMVVAKDKTEALVTYVMVKRRANSRSRNIKLLGLDPDKTYRIEGQERTYLGSTLMNAGILAEDTWGDNQAWLYHIVEA